MGKKLQSKPKWKRHIRRRQEYQLERARRTHGRLRQPLRRAIVPQRLRKSFSTLVAPPEFCILQNPEGVIRYLNKLKYTAVKDNVMVDLQEVTNLTAETVALLIGTMRDVKEFAYVRGNLPKDDAARQTLVNCGFFDVVHTTEPIGGIKRGGFVEKRSMKRVDPTVAQELIHLGTKSLHGEVQKRRGAYTTLLELMGNTHNHAAADAQGHKSWLAMVFADEPRKRICYAFLDTGVGIFKSVRLSKIRQMYRKLGLDNNAKILRDILEGRIPSSTGIPYRGKGLPAIYTASESGRILSLVVVTNDVFADVSKADYRVMGAQLGGTLLYWETE